MTFFSQSLSQGWFFKQADEPSPSSWLSVASIPSVVQQDLLAHKRIPDPFIGFNELKAEWVGEKDWIYRRVVEKPPIPTGSRVFLVFDGLDTFATVTLDSKVILESDNMFLSHRIDVTRAFALTTEGTGHVLEIRFDSALLRAREIQKNYPHHKWIASNGEAARLGVRKAQYHWGWDWGPVLMTAGIWRDVRLEVYHTKIADLWAEVQLTPDHQVAHVTATAIIETSNNDVTAYRTTFSLCLDDVEIARESTGVNPDGISQTVFKVVKPKLWWPHGYGEQARYQLAVAVTQDDCPQDVELHHIAKNIGIRTAEVIQQADKHGKSFFFRINDVDIFCGGSCWIPADSSLPVVTAERYRKWIQLMIAGHQVMIRVWGGGIYEDDAFYDACDELGVMVWQDFMFSCGNYPTWPALLESVKKEAIQNISRLRHHPSIVIYAGNNEDYQIQEQEGLTYNYADQNRDNWLKTDFPARFIYEELLPSVVKEYSPDVFYHPGSPWGDGKSTSDPTVGDLHQWNVWHGRQEKYQIFGKIGGRFNSEFGMEAFPHLETIEYFVEDKSELFPQSHTLDFHNKAAGHERRLATYLAENVRMMIDLESYIYLTQVVQAETMMYGYRAWRRQWGDGRHCGGALVWQLNDCWPAISWAIVDYFLRPKPAYYAMARILQPVAVGVEREHHDWSVSHARPVKASKFELWAVNSGQEELEALVELRAISVDTGLEVRDRIVHEHVRLVANGTTNIIRDGIIDHSIHPEPYVLAARMWINGHLVARDVDWPQPFKYLDLSDRGLEIRELEVDSAAERRLLISTKKPVKCLVFEERLNVTLSDSALDIIPGDSQMVTVMGLKEGDEPLRWTFLDQENMGEKRK